MGHFGKVGCLRRRVRLELFLLVFGQGHSWLLGVVIDFLKFHKENKRRRRHFQKRENLSDPETEEPPATIQSPFEGRFFGVGRTDVDAFLNDIRICYESI